MRNPMSAFLVAAALLVPGAALAAPAKPAVPVAIPMKKDGGVYVVPVSVNGSVTIDCIVDSGATDVNLPSGVYDRLVREGSLRESDMLGTRTYTLADGSTQRGRVVRIKALKVGGVIVKDVVASVGGDEASALLGQSFLERFPSWSLDNKRHVLVLAGIPSAAAPHETARPHESGGGPHHRPRDGAPTEAQEQGGTSHAPHNHDNGGNHGDPDSTPAREPSDDGLTAQHSGRD